MSIRLSNRVVPKTSAYTVSGYVDSAGTLFTNRGATGSVTFTLPTPHASLIGKWYLFQVVADYTVIVAGATAGDLITRGNAAANNVSFPTASAKLGGIIVAFCDGTKWICAGYNQSMAVNGTEEPLRVGGTALTATAAELNYNDRAGAVGVAEASKTAVLGATKNLDELGIAKDGLKIGASGAEVAMTCTAAELNQLDGAVITPAQLTALATAQGGLAAILAAGLGGSHSVLKSETGTHPVVALHATKARACLVVVTVDEVYADAGGTQPVVEVGETDTIDKCFDHTKLVNAALGSVWVFAFTNTANKAIVITTTAAVTTGTGGCTVAVLAIPTT